MAERVNRTVVERARCLLFEARLSKSFWAEAVAAATYLINRSPTKGHPLTPEEAWSGRKPDLSHVRVFGAKAMAHIPKCKRKKWDVKSREAILVGFDEETKAYRLYHPSTRDVFKSRDVVFIHEPSYCDTRSPSPARKQVKAGTFVNLDIEDVLYEPVARPAGTTVVPAHVVKPEPADTDDESINDSTSDPEVSTYFLQVECSDADVSDEDTSDRTIVALPPQQTLDNGRK